MNLCVTTKHYQVSSSLWEAIERNVEKLKYRLPHLNPNLGLIKLVIKRNKRRNYFDGSVSLSVPKKHLYAHFIGFYPEEEVKNAFERLFKELCTYKGKHFTNDSRYFRHDSIRQYFGQ
ncbi:hypothetical protein A2870_00560 [Candidatus Curtissbacteria bacterium RIFCSPHIGHO2_01_FULL_41_11]|uniref:Uncharacterized protein n=1 Tax=Candidatus Curtissbacteria bacterium RIFCSPHIGHO2_01_FULL_41_11 TaxID=1797711 RepID=A0A1F5G3G6_9BACT|nr:MAG: hypothetical protein A2870_00560 [Candidatus Curtissbacteria bacterium RIFCSPHIGHO2_01_FULL_41_11]